MKKNGAVKSVQQTTPSSAPLKVLHIAFTMNARGTETWLMNLMRRMDPARVQMDFITVKGEAGFYDAEIKELGGFLRACASPKNKGAFLRDFRRILKQHGPYDVVHGHPYGLNGLLMLQAARARVPVRITHSHTDRRKVMRDKSPLRLFYHWVMRQLIARFSTHGLAASQAAAKALFGRDWRRNKKWQVVHCGIDLAPFRNLTPDAGIRQEFGIEKTARIIGHVGSFHFEKNHDFLIRLFAVLVKNDPTLMLMLVGDGPLREQMIDLAKQLGVAKNIIFTGMRGDVPDLLSAMDVFVFPSLFEGLGLALIEAQAAGIPCVIADTIPPEALQIPELMQTVPLVERGDSNLEQWIDAVGNALQRGKMEQGRALAVIEKTDFNIDNNAKAILSIYEGARADG